MSYLQSLPRDGRERWNRVHEAYQSGALPVSDPGALSGSPAVEVLSHHGVAEMICPGLVVLDIGVGLGGMSKYLQESLCIVDALDVADAAEKTVASCARKFYAARDIADLPEDEYDLALSMIVSQHMCDADLRKQVKYVVRALKPGGLFSLHLAGATDAENNNIPGLIPQGKDGAMCRTEDYALELIGGAVDGAYTAEVTARRMEFPQFGSYWYFIHIRRGTDG